MLEIILIRGLPGSGKTTLAEALCAEYDYEHVEADHFFETKNGYDYNPMLVSNAHRYCQERATDYLEQGRSVIVSNTFARHWEMAYYIGLAERNGYAFRVVVCAGNYPSVHCGPDSVAAVRERWED